MIHELLLPADAQEGFAALRDQARNPLYYRLHPQRLGGRIARKLGLSGNTDRLLDSLFEISGSPRRLANIEAVWLSDRVTLPPHLLQALLDRMPALRWVYWQRTGTEDLDLDYFRKRNIALSNAGNLVSGAVAEMAIACILSHAKRLPQHHALQRRCRWRPLTTDFCSRQTVGIIGSGNIGRETARLCRALGMRTLLATRDPARLGGTGQLFDQCFDLHREFEHMLSMSDYVVVAVPLTPSTRSLIGRRQFSAMRPGAVLVNVARHAVVDEPALLSALAQGEIAAAYTDPPPGRRLFFLDRLYRTSNLYLTHNSCANFRQKPAMALERFMRGIEQEAQSGDFPDRVV